MPTARTRANRKYNEKAYARIALTVAKSNKDDIQLHAKKMHESLNGFINRAISETIQRDCEGEVHP